MAKIKRDLLEETNYIVEKAGMTYGQFQQLETLGLAKIAKGQVLVKVNNHWEVKNEHN